MGREEGKGRGKERKRGETRYVCLRSHDLRYNFFFGAYSYKTNFLEKVFPSRSISSILEGL